MIGVVVKRVNDSFCRKTKNPLSHAWENVRVRASALRKSCSKVNDWLDEITRGASLFIGTPLSTKFVYPEHLRCGSRGKVTEVFDLDV